jgi:MYND finger.
MPEIRTEVLKDKNWKEIAEYQKQNYFKDDEKSLKEDIERMASLYDYNILEGLIEGFKCAGCGKDATKRCSKCKSEFYCSRECQVIGIRKITKSIRFLIGKTTSPSVYQKQQS